MASESDSEIFEVEKILKQRKRGKTLEYLVRWRGFDSDEDSWEPAKNLQHCVEAIDAFNKTLEAAKSPALLSPRSTRKSRSRTVKTTSSSAVTPAAPAEPAVTPSRVTRRAMASKQEVTVTETYSVTKTQTQASTRSLSASSGDSDAEGPSRVSQVRASLTTNKTDILSMNTEGRNKAAITSPSNVSRLCITRYDIPVIIFVSCLIFVAISFMVQT